MGSARTIAGRALPKKFSSTGKYSSYTIKVSNREIPKYEEEFWTSRQRQSSSLHEISYRACFKAEVPRFFIKWLTEVNDTVYDPFNGRGTTIIEAGLLGRKVIANDINPLSEVLSRPRFSIPSLEKLKKRLIDIRTDPKAKADIDLSMFFHPQTEAEIVSLKNYLFKRKSDKNEDAIDRWIRMVATNRLTGHSKGFFSVYTLPPNQAVSQESQIKINRRLKQKPEYRDIRKLILKKSISLVRKLKDNDIATLNNVGRSAKFYIGDARNTPKIKNNSVTLTVTSPHFLDTINYYADNWLRCWFNTIDSKKVSESIRESKSVQGWSAMMEDVFKELLRITKDGGWVAFEVGEVRNASIKLEEIVLPIGERIGFKCQGILINRQKFTKTAHIWGVHNNNDGTNTNRILLFRKG
jgi:DNA modification methylase